MVLNVSTFTQRFIAGQADLSAPQSFFLRTGTTVPFRVFFYAGKLADTPFAPANDAPITLTVKKNADSTAILAQGTAEGDGAATSFNIDLLTATDEFAAAISGISSIDCQISLLYGESPPFEIEPAAITARRSFLLGAETGPTPS